MLSYYIKNVETMMLSLIAGIEEFPGFELKVEKHPDNRELKMMFFDLCSKGIVIPDGEKYKLNDEYGKIMSIIKNADIYGMLNQSSYIYFHDDGVLITKASRFEKYTLKFTCFDWDELFYEWEDIYGCRPNPEIVPDDSAGKALKIAEEYFNEKQKYNELKQNIPFCLNVFKDPSNQDGMDILGIRMDIYNFLANKSEEEQYELGEFSLDKIFKMINKYRHSN